MSPEVLYIIISAKVEKLEKDERGFYIDSLGTIWALAEAVNSVDPVNRCGIGVFSLPTTERFKDLNEICSVHDYMTSSIVFMTFHTRKEADDYLKNIKHPLLKELFYNISRVFSRYFWEVSKTR